ncbi:hypothetical protein OIDMADRAFT_137385 [Oidiodendron maius Zn]|uniref:SnoaL-like domain-containing protein n=1 Tax=Oidiodendron maius (strain Zn) TaxID=913774 RepID=A0A0C3C448_OIDMZ|nr:hypothetical protein OIDMADRAFT_137385 [Oidiodendron maius Zn]
MAYPQSLGVLSTREEITDLVVRACLGFDSNDKPLWESVWAESPDIIFEINGNVMKGIDEMNKNCFDIVGPMDTQHLISSIRIDVKDGADTAHMTANALAQHYHKGQGQVPDAEHMLAGSTYIIHAVKEYNGLWKIKSWVLKIIWTQGSWAVMQPKVV